MTNAIVLVFPSRETLVDAVERLKALPYVDVKNTALIAKAADGEITVYDNDITVAEGSITGGTLGSLMAALGVAQLGAFLLPGVGPIVAIGAGALLGALVGGATGGVAAGLVDFGFNNAQLDALAAQLEAGRMAAVIELEDHANAVPRLRQDLHDFQVEILTPSGRD